MINRAAVILKYRQIAVDWINDADPYNENPGITLDDVNTERTVFLVHEDVADSPYALEKWVKNNYKTLFEVELEGWYADPTLWPKDQSLKQFNKWFKTECHSVIEDTLDEPIVDDGL